MKIKLAIFYQKIVYRASEKKTYERSDLELLKSASILT